MNTSGSAPLLNIENLRTHIHTNRGLVRAVDGVSFKLCQGKTLGIVGESGSGKSVLCRTILRLLPRTAVVPNNSCISFNGHDLSKISEKEFNSIRGRDIAMIFQDPMSSLNPVMKVGKQIAETLSHHLKMKRKPARDRAVELMKSVGISMPEQRVNQYPHQLSGGVRQRVAIAIALACDPKLLIADEPTTALDVTVQAEILDLLARRQSQGNMSMILITHDLGVAAGRACDIIVMYAGKIVEQAPAPELFSNVRMPYTKALMDSIPRLENLPHTTLNSINGQPPDLINPHSGCCFAPRCSRAQKRCIETEPPLMSDIRKDHLFACWYPVGGPAS